jgi:hypothetical protein
MRRARTLAERFNEKYLVDRDTGCWEWQAATFADSGYALIGVHGKPRHAHRVAYELFVGPIPDGLVIDHLCVNARCVSPNLALVRVCRTCRAANEQRHIQKRREERAA